VKLNLLKPLALALALLVVAAQPTFAATAYIDPNTGGMLFQLLAVIFTFISGIILFFSSQIKMAFARLRRFFRGRSGKETG
jgi:hypothetical protein